MRTYRSSIRRRRLCHFELIIGATVFSIVAYPALGQGVQHAPALQIARYSIISPEPTPGQEELLAGPVAVTFPASVVTVRDALETLLAPAGYRLAPVLSMGPDVLDLLELPLPDVHRQFEPLPIEQILQLLVGPAFTVVHDPVHRMIAFERCHDLNLFTETP